MESASINPTQPSPALVPSMPGVFGLLKLAIANYKKNFHSFLKIGAVLLAIFTVEGIILTLISPEMVEPVTFTGTFILFMVLTIVTAIINAILQIAFSISLIKTAAAADSGIQINERDIVKGSFKLFWAYIWVHILLSLVGIGSLALLIIPGIVAAVFFGFAPFFLVLDNRRGVNSLAASLYYVSGNWWRVLWRGLGITLILAAIIVILIGIVILIVWAMNPLIFTEAGFIQAAEGFKNINKDLSKGISIVWGIISNFVWLCVLAPIGVLYNYFLYKNLKLRKEEPDQAVDLNDTRPWIIGLSIWGALIPAFILLIVIIGAFAVGVMSGLQGARNNQPTLEQSLDKLPAFTTAPEEMKIKNPENLIATPFIDKKLNVSIQLPKGWEAQNLGDDGLIARDPTQTEGNIDAIYSIQYYPDEYARNDEEARMIFQGIWDNNTNLSDPIMTKYKVGPYSAYVLEALLDGGSREGQYYLIPAEGGVFAIAAFWWQEIPWQKKSTILDSIATFRIL